VANEKISMERERRQIRRSSPVDLLEYLNTTIRSHLVRKKKKMVNRNEAEVLFLKKRRDKDKNEKEAMG